MRNHLSTFFSRIGIVCFSLLLLSHTVDAKLVYDKAFIKKTHAPNSATDVPMLSFTLKSNDTDVNVNRIRIKNISSSVQFGKGVKAVHLYRESDDGNLGLLDKEVDIEIASKQSIPQGLNPDIDLTFTNELVSSANPTGKSFLITYDFDQTKGLENLGGTANLTLVEITCVSAADNLDLVSERISPTTNSVIITGVRFLNVVDISPKVVLPGQKNVPMFAISMAVKGESIVKGSEVTFTLFNEQNNIVTESGKTDGVVKSSMFFSNFSPDENGSNKIKYLDATPKIVKTGSDPGSSFRSKSTFDFKFPPYVERTSFQGFTGGLNGVTQNFYIFYDIGDNISVTSETKVSAQLIQFSGFGNNSNLALTWPLSGQELFAPSEVLVAGLSLESLSSLIPQSTVFGVRNTIPMLKIRMRANHSSATLNAVSIVNDGSVPFQTSLGSKTNIVRVSIYNDSNGDGLLSTQQDTRIGHVLLGSKDSNGETVNEATVVRVPIIQETSPTINGIFISEYDSTKTYPRNKEKILFVVYESGEIINGGLDASGNITRKANAKLGNIDATAILSLDNDEVTTNAVTLSGISNSTPKIATPISSVEFNQGANLALTDVHDISPDTAVQGELLVPMLSALLISDRAFSSTNITILNESKSFLTNNTGVSKVWIYKDLPPYEKFDGSDVFLAATTTFESRDNAVVKGVPLSLGENHILVLYSIGQDDKGSTTDLISEGAIKAQIKDITSEVERETLVLGGTTPQPDIAASVDVVKSPIINVVLDSITAEDTSSTFNVKVRFTNNSDQDIKLQDVSFRVYLSKLSGLDVTYEFSTSLASSKLTSIGAGQTALQSFSTRHSKAFNEGTGIVDVFLRYLITPSSSAVISRYLGPEGWESAAAKTRSITLIKTISDYPWIFPSYVSGVFFERGGETTAFSQGMTLRSTDTLIIKFKDKGSFIDSTNFKIFRNGVQVTRSDFRLASADTFSYDDTTGTLTIANVGDIDGKIEVFVSDGTNELEPITLTFAVSNEIKIIQPLFYPNPYPLGSEDLILGFNITQPATIDFYFFNYVGLEIFHTSETFTKTGYNTLTFSKTSKIFSQGVFVCKMIAKDANGNKSVATAKLSAF